MALSLLSERERALANTRASQGRSRSFLSKTKLMRTSITIPSSYTSDSTVVRDSISEPLDSKEHLPPDQIVHAARIVKRKSGSVFLSSRSSASLPEQTIESSDFLNMSSSEIPAVTRVTRLWVGDSDSDMDKELPVPVRQSPIAGELAIQEELVDWKELNASESVDDVTLEGKGEKRLSKKLRRDSFGLVVKNPKGKKRLSMTSGGGNSNASASPNGSIRAKIKRDDDDSDVDEVDEIYEKTILQALEDLTLAKRTSQVKL